MAKPHLKLITPAIENRTVTTPRRKPNAELRTREYLTEAEIERLIEAAKGNRHGHRDATMILVAYRHGLRASELVDLRWDQIDFNRPPCTSAGSSRAPLRRIQSWATNCEHCAGCSASRSPGLPFMFTSERRLALHHSWLCQTGGARRCGRWPGLPGPSAHARHACGFTLANKGTDTRTLQAYLGHKNIQHTVRYTELAPGRFKDIWRS